MPQPFWDLDSRTLGTVERVWRQRDGELAHVWAEGTLNPGERMPARYARDVHWVTEHLLDVERRLRMAAEEICRQVGDDWRKDLAAEMRCDTTDVGVGPVGRQRDSEPIEESNFRVLLRDLQSIDGRVTTPRFRHWGFGWLEELAVPLDNPLVSERIEKWVAALERYPVADELDLADLESERQADAELPIPEPDERGRAAELRHRLDTLGSSDPPDLGR